MKMNWKKALAALMAFAAVWTLAACSAKNEPAPAPAENAPASDETRMPIDYHDEDDDTRTEEYKFEFNGRTVNVDMTLNDGWWVYVTDEFVFLYDPETPSESEGIAYGYLTTDEEFQTEWDTYTSLDDCQWGELGFTATLNGTGIHAFALGDGIFYTIITFKPEEAGEIYDRFHVWLEGGDDEHNYEAPDIDEYEFSVKEYKVHVEVTVSGGWRSSHEPSLFRGVICLYAPENPSESIATGHLLNADEYEGEWEFYSDYDECNRGDRGFSASGDGQSIHVRAVGDGIYYKIVTNKPEKAAEIFARFNFWLEEDNDYYDDEDEYNDDEDDTNETTLVYENEDGDIAQYEFEFHGHDVLVQVDVSDGWRSKVGDAGIVLLFDPETSLRTDGIASCALLTEEEYEEEWERCNSPETRGELGFTAISDEEGVHAYVVDDGVYCVITTLKPEELTEIDARFNVSLVMG